VASFVLAAGVVATLVGCTQQAPTGKGAPGFSNADAGHSAPPAAAQPNGKGQAPAVAVGAADVRDRKLVRTARLAVTAPDVTTAVDNARQIAMAAGGYTGAERATLSLAVPSDKLDAVVGQLFMVGTVTSREHSAQDVTEQTVDIESRLASQRASVERMRALLAKANSVGEVASVEGELTSRESELESPERRRDALAGSVAMSTVMLSVNAAVPPPAPSDAGGFFGGLATGWDAFLTFGGGALAVSRCPRSVSALTGHVAVLWWLRRRLASES
jgi:hypothetical protein